MQGTNHKNHGHIRCLGSREILKPEGDVPKHILGVVEFESSCVPVVDIGAAYGIGPMKIDNSKCILIVEHNYKSEKLYTGIIIQDYEEIMKLAAGFFSLGAGIEPSINMRFVLDVQNSHDDGFEILVESHKALEETEVPEEFSGLQPSGSYSFINELRAMNFLQRQVLLEELANEPELWEGNVMCL